MTQDVFANRVCRFQTFLATGEEVVVEESFGPLMGGSTAPGGMVAGVNAQAAIDKRIGVMVTEVHVEPVTGADQG